MPVTTPPKFGRLTAPVRSAVPTRKVSAPIRPWVWIATAAGAVVVLLIGALILSDQPPPPFIAAVEPAPAAAETRVAVKDIGTAFVFDRAVQAHSCATAECPVLTEHHFRSRVEILELKEGWARLTEFRNPCEGAQSEFSDTEECNPLSGITPTPIAEWVAVSGLTAKQPPDPGAKATELAKFVAGSDDFDLYEAQFVAALPQIVALGTCTTGDIEKMNGWRKAPEFNPRSVYSIVCGQRKAYLDVANGAVSE
jgi:hypothetical protein